MAKDLVLEIGVEDLPSDIGEYLEKNFLPLFENKLESERIYYKNLKIFYTPRRIIVFLKSLEEKQREKIVEIYGPPLDICLDENGEWNEVAKKFAESNKVKLKDLKILERKGKKVLGIVKEEKGESIEKIFNKIINETLKQLEIPRGMIWNGNRFKFFRPIRYIICLYGEKLIPVEIGDIKSKRFTWGHRILSDKKIVPKNTVDFFDKILKNYVIFDQELRKKMIIEQIKKFSYDNFVYDFQLIEKVVPLVEYPFCGICNLPESYKNLPKEVLNSIILNIKGIPLFDNNDNLLPFFIIVCDGIFNDKIKENYEKVVESKIEDVNFFIERDRKKPLIEYLSELKNIVYHPKFGTIYDRVERIRKISNFILESLNLDLKIKEKIDLIVSLCKNDLATLMVSEFPSLQGIVGRIYAEKDGYEKLISKSIEQHYFPRFQGDKKPEFIESAIVSIADRIETLCGFISEGVEIKGDQDPLGLKRIATGMIEIIWDKGFEISIEKLVEKTLEILNRKDEGTKNIILDFIRQRTENSLALEGIKPGLRRAVFSVEKDNLYQIKMKIEAAKEIFIKGKGEQVLIPFIRVANMLKQAKERKIEYGSFDEGLLIEDAEKQLFKFYKENSEMMEKLYREKKYKEFLEGMTKWKEPIDRFFKEVFVMVEDEKIRNNRLSLLELIDKVFNKFADFSYIPLREVENVK
ncbi:MAG: glycine--tRNA ligase subunit beta [Candidatus Omnitrophica bacterium]|nr:glycine--tRNA ligase subunit beta [Candidatus Omnitrophota bacterium]